MIELHTCERNDKASVTEKHCIARQEFLTKYSYKNGYASGQYRDINDFCGGCQTGLALFEKSKTEKPKQEERPMEKRACAECGVEFPPTENHFRKAGRGLSKVCLECEGKPAEKEVKPVGAAPGKEPETKPCELPGCKKMCVQRPDEMAATFTTRKYCSDECKREARRIRDRAKRQLAVKPGFCLEDAEGIARDAAYSAMKLFSVFLDGGQPVTHDQIRAVAIQAGIECQRIVAGAE